MNDPIRGDCDKAVRAPHQVTMVVRMNDPIRGDCDIALFCNVKSSNLGSNE